MKRFLILVCQRFQRKSEDKRTEKCRPIYVERENKEFPLENKYYYIQTFCRLQKCYHPFLPITMLILKDQWDGVSMWARGGGGEEV